MTEFVEISGKPWWLSKGVWGPLIAILSMVFAATGVALDAGVLVEAILQLVALAGALLGLWGRVDAKEPIRRSRDAG